MHSIDTWNPGTCVCRSGNANNGGDRAKPTSSTCAMPILWCYAMESRASPRDERGTWGTPQQHGTQLSEEKTKVTHITEGFNFLGYRIMRSIGTSGKMIPKVLIPARPSHASAMPYAECLPQPHMSLLRPRSLPSTASSGWWPLSLYE